MALTSSIAQTAGLAQSAVGAYSTAKGQKYAYASAARVAEMNAQRAELSAQSAFAKGEREYQRSRLQTGQLKSTQRAAMAANGIDLQGSTTAAAILTGTDYMGEVDANTIQANAVAEAWGLRSKATNYQNEAIENRAAGKAVSTLGAVSQTLLTGAPALADRWNTVYKSGALKAAVDKSKQRWGAVKNFVTGKSRGSTS